MSLFKSLHGFDLCVFLQISNKSQSHVQRTPKECEIRWLGDRHPEFNHSVWNQSETNQCRDLVSAYTGPVDWVKVSEELGVSYAFYQSDMTHRTAGM